MVRAALLELDKSGDTVDDRAELRVVGKVAKTYRESIEGFEKGDRPERAEKDRRALAVVETYLPSQLEESEIVGIAARIADEIGPLEPTDFGKLMPRVIAETKGRADGRLVKEVVTRLLTGEADQ